jgi:arylsulfatase A-like enzyme
MDFLATVLDILKVERPASQADWAFDGQSVMPILTQQGTFETRGIGWMYQNVQQNGYRYGPWKLVNNSKSCSNKDCAKPMLFNLDTDIGETTDVAAQNPDVFRAILANFTSWYESVLHSRVAENTCTNEIPPETMLPDIF